MNGQTPPSTGSRVGRPDYFILALLGISLVGNVVLGLGMFRMASMLSATASSQRPDPESISVGTTLPPLDAQRVEGGREQVALQGQPTVLYIFRSDCSWCAKNAANASALLRAAQGRYKILALSLDKNFSSKPFAQPSVDVPIFVDPAPGVRAAYRLGPTPQTLVVGADGRVLKSWVGAYSGAVEKEVEAFFKVDLPGLVEASSH